MYIPCHRKCANNFRIIQSLLYSRVVFIYDVLLASTVTAAREKYSWGWSTAETASKCVFLTADENITTIPDHDSAHTPFGVVRLESKRGYVGSPVANIQHPDFLETCSANKVSRNSVFLFFIEEWCDLKTDIIQD